MSDALLEIEALAAGYGEVQVLWGLSLAAARGRLTTLVGANGAGKTTTLRATLGTISPWSGRVIFKGEDVTGLPAHAKAARGLVLVPEGRQLFSNMTVDENLEMGAFTKRGARGYADRLERVFTLFPRLKERRRQKAGTFSGGEQQMLAIARGLMARPEVLMLDEPSLGLAPRLLETLYGLLAELREEGTTILLVDQMAALALSVADRAYVLQSGSIRHSGTAHEVGQDPALLRAYLGDRGTVL